MALKKYNISEKKLKVNGVVFIEALCDVDDNVSDYYSGAGPEVRVIPAEAFRPDREWQSFSEFSGYKKVNGVEIPEIPHAYSLLELEEELEFENREEGATHVWEWVE